MIPQKTGEVLIDFTQTDGGIPSNMYLLFRGAGDDANGLIITILYDDDHPFLFEDINGDKLDENDWVE